MRTNKAKYQYNDSPLLWLFRERRKKQRSCESRVLCDVVPTHRTPAGDWITADSSPPSRHQSDPRQPSLRFSLGRRGVSPSFTSGENSSGRFLSPYEGLWFPLPAVFPTIRQKSQNEIRPLFHFIRQSQGCWPRAASESLTNTKDSKQKGERGFVWHRTFVSYFPSIFSFYPSSCSQKECSVRTEIFISSRTELKLCSWALNYSFPTDKPRPCSGVHAAAGHMVLYKNARFVAQRRHSSHGGCNGGCKTVEHSPCPRVTN